MPVILRARSRSGGTGLGWPECEKERDDRWRGPEYSLRCEWLDGRRGLDRDDAPRSQGIWSTVPSRLGFLGNSDIRVQDNTLVRDNAPDERSSLA